MSPPFRRVLVANRGEIAVRVIRACQALGIETVAVHSDVDAEAPFVRLADQAVAIGPAPPAESYLRLDAIVEAARSTGAEAIHPGYGFLSERPELPEACAAAGLVFVGPPPEAMRLLGLEARGARPRAGARRADGAGQPERRRRGRGAGGRGRARLPADRQAVGGRRRHRHEGRGGRRGARGGPGRGDEGRAGVVRRPDGVPRALRPLAAARRGAGAVRRARRPRAPRRARVLAAAPPPEAAGGVAVAGGRAGAARPHGRGRAARRRGRGLRQRRHGRVHARRRATSTSWRSTRGCRSSTP